MHPCVCFPSASFLRLWIRLGIRQVNAAIGLMHVVLDVFKHTLLRSIIIFILLDAYWPRPPVGGWVQLSMYIVNLNFVPGISVVSHRSELIEL